MGIDRALFTSAEEAMYDQLIREKNALPRLYHRAGFNWPGHVWATLATWFALWVGALGVITWSMITPPTRGIAASEIDQNTALFLLVSILIVGAIFPYVWMKQDLRGIEAGHARADANIEAFLAELDYPRRQKAERRDPGPKQQGPNEGVSSSHQGQRTVWALELA